MFDWEFLNDRNVSVHSSVWILIFFIEIVGKSADLAVIVKLRFKCATVVICAEVFIAHVWFWLFLDDTEIAAGLIIVKELGFRYSELHSDDIFFNVPPRLEHFYLELIDSIQVFFSELYHLLLDLGQKVIHYHGFVKRKGWIGLILNIKFNS